MCGILGARRNIAEPTMFAPANVVGSDAAGAGADVNPLAPGGDGARVGVMTENTTMSGQRWVAFGPAGAVGSIHRTDEGFLVRLLDGSEERRYPSLDVAKSALHASLPAGSDWPEFREH